EIPAAPTCDRPRAKLRSYRPLYWALFSDWKLNVINLPASFLALLVEPAFQFHFAPAAGTPACRPAAPRVPASPPVQFPAWRIAPQNLCRDLPPRLRGLRAESLGAPR